MTVLLWLCLAVVVSDVMMICYAVLWCDVCTCLARCLALPALHCRYELLNWLKVFDLRQFLVITLEEFIQDPKGTLRKILEFLGLYM